jgi:[ribosomal protein S5]-alanine N-acetyltransferase
MLQTSRLILREYMPSDFDVLRTIHGDADVQQMRGGRVLTEQETHDEIRDVLAAQRERPRLRYQWMLENEQQVIGYCHLHIQNRETRVAEIGYFLRASAWGSGYATEAARELLRFGFGQLHLHRIAAGCIDLNTVPVRVMEKIGMQFEGRLREDRRLNGEWHDTLLYAILDREWRDANA